MSIEYPNFQVKMNSLKPLPNVLSWFESRRFKNSVESLFKLGRNFTSGLKLYAVMHIPLAPVVVKDISPQVVKAEIRSIIYCITNLISTKTSQSFPLCEKIYRLHNFSLKIDVSLLFLLILPINFIHNLLVAYFYFRKIFLMKDC